MSGLRTEDRGERGGGVDRGGGTDGDSCFTG